MKEVITFGEIMIRLVPPGALRLTQAHTLELTFGGAEANVAVSLATYGIPSRYVTRLPENDLADACVNTLRSYGVGVDAILRGGSRMGIYFLEAGAAQRGSKVIYDRSGSAMALLEPGMIEWRMVFQNAGWFHWTGITPALSASAAAACLEAVKIAREMDVTVSFDFNYRKNLWKWGKTPAEVIPELVSYCDMLIGSEEDVRMFGIQVPSIGIPAENKDQAYYQPIFQSLSERFPRLKTIAFTRRGSISASHNTWSGVLWRDEKLYTSTTYDIEPIIDRVGSGDAFTAGLIYGLLTAPQDPQYAVDFGAAATCLKHTIPGDFNCVTISEVENLMSGDTSGRVSR